MRNTRNLFLLLVTVFLPVPPPLTVSAEEELTFAGGVAHLTLMMGCPPVRSFVANTWSTLVAPSRAYPIVLVSLLPLSSTAKVEFR